MVEDNEKENPFDEKFGTGKKIILGQPTRITANLTAPIKMEHDMSFNRLMILVGQNATGKSLLLKMVWASCMTMVGVIAGRSGQTTLPAPYDLTTVPGLIDYTQFVWDGTFTDQNFDGEVSLFFPPNELVELNMVFEKGKVVSVTSNAIGTETIPQPIFMSGPMRLFSAMEQYCLISPKLTDKERTETYRLYDMLYIETLKMKIGADWTVPERLKATLKGMDIKLDIQTMHYDDSKFWYGDSNGDKHRLAHLSAGEQAILNMFVGQAQ